MKELRQVLTQTDESIITDFDHEAEARRQARNESARRIALTVHLVLFAVFVLVTCIEWITSRDIDHAIKVSMTMLGLVSIADFVNSMLQNNFRPYATVLTSKVSDLPRLLKKAKSVATLDSHDERRVAGVWNSLEYLKKHLYPHHQREITDESITYLSELLTSETIPERLSILLSIATTAANQELLPHLAALQERSIEIDPEGTLADPLAKAIESCSPTESKTARAIGGLSQ